MNFPSIDIQGSILSTDLLAKIRSEQATFLPRENRQNIWERKFMDAQNFKNIV